MTIGELETAVDMPRANIRFYEKEGFVRPARGANKYRDYSAADAETLLRVKLLRRLQLPLAEIRALQRGEASLAAVLAARAGELEGECAALAQAEAVCRALQREDAAFDALDAEKYLRTLDASPEGAALRVAAGDTLPSFAHPWRRYWARSVDLLLASLLWRLFLNLVLRYDLSGGTAIGSAAYLLQSLLGLAAALGLTLLLEPVFLSKFGTTPGKWLLGLVVREADGRFLTPERARFRTRGVIVSGLGCGVPVWSLVCASRCYSACRRDEPMPWDAGLGYGVLQPLSAGREPLPGL